jgi:hypothetical protein
MIKSHFADRAKERGYTGNTDDLMKDIKDILRGSTASRVVFHMEHVIDVGRGYQMHRFTVLEGAFYAITYEDRLITFLTQEQAKFQKAMMKPKSKKKQRNSAVRVTS